MSIYRYIILLAILCCVTFPLAAEEEQLQEQIQKISGITDEDCTKAAVKKTLGLYDLYAIAVKYSEKIKIEYENVAQAEAVKQQAIGSFLPSISLRTGTTFPVNSSSKYPVTFMKNGLFLYARQPILTGLNEYSAYKGSTHELMSRSHGLKYAAVQLLFDVSVGYYNILLIGKSLATKDEILKLYYKNLDELNHRVQIGKSRMSDVLKTNAEIYKLEANILSMKTQLASAKRSLSTIIGKSLEDVNFLDADALPDPGYAKEDTDKLMEERWDVKAAAEDVKKSGVRVLAAMGGYLPSLYLEGAYRLYQINKTGPDYYVGIGAELPLFSGFITYSQVKGAKSLQKQSELKLKQTKRVALQDIMDSFSSWESSIKEVDAYKKALKSADANYKASLNDYRLNLVTILDVITSLTMLQHAKEDYDKIVLQNSLNRIRLGIAVNEFTGAGIKTLQADSKEAAKGQGK